jgi:gliding motility-associated-like protein
LRAHSPLRLLATAAASLIALSTVPAPAGAGTAADSTPPRITSHSVAPDPFTPNGDGKNDRTTIHWTLKDRALVTLKVFKFQGHLVRDLMKQHLQPGKWHIKWNGRDDSGHIVPKGKYSYRIRATDNAGNARAVKGTVTVE